MSEDEKKGGGGQGETGQDLDVIPPAPSGGEQPESGDPAVVQELETIPPDPGARKPPGASEDGDQIKREMDTIPPDPGG